MNKNLLSTFFLLLIATSLIRGQSLMEVQEIKLQPKAQFYNTSDSAIVFPQFIGSPFTQKINKELLDYLKKYEDDHSSVLQILESLRDDGLGESYYETFYSKNTISLRLWMAWYRGSHPSYTDNYLTFSTSTGSRLTLDSLLTGNHESSIAKIIDSKKKSYLENYKKELEKRVADPGSKFDKNDFELALNRASKYCFDKIDYSNLKIDKEKISIGLDCGFPSIARAYAPYKDLIFEKESFQSILKKEYQ